MASKETEFNIDFVKLESGNIPFNNFLDSLSKLERTEVLSLIEEFRTLKSNDDDLPRSMSKFLRDGIYEIRARHRTRISRSLYFFTIGKLIVFTHGFIKKTERTPADEINKAIKYRKIYLKAQNHGK